MKTLEAKSHTKYVSFFSLDGFLLRRFRELKAKKHPNPRKRGWFKTKLMVAKLL